MKVRVSAKTEKFRRAGFEFTREPIEIEVDKQTFARLKAEPMLAIETVTDNKAETK